MKKTINFRESQRIGKKGLKSKDALHVACAIEGKAEYSITTDDKILKKTKGLKKIEVVDPIQFITILEGTLSCSIAAGELRR